jgi:hypothetical protein
MHINLLPVNNELIKDVFYMRQTQFLIKRSRGRSGGG